MKALILAAGRGEKFHPFSYYRPKPLFPIANRPLMEYTLRELVELGVGEVGIVVGHRGGRIRAYFGDGSKFGCSISYIEQPEPSGTGDAVLRARGWAKGEECLVVYGDLYIPKGVLRRVLDAVPDAESGVAALGRGPRGGDRGVAAEVEDGKVLNYHWKDPHYRDLPVLWGIYVLKEPAWKGLDHLPDVVEEVANGIFPPEEADLASLTKVMAGAGMPLDAVEVEGIVDMDFPWQPLEVFRRVVGRMAEELAGTVVEEGAEIEEGAKVEGRIYLARGARILRGAYVRGPAWVGENTVIREGAHIHPNTVIGRDCTIGPYCEVSGCVGNRCRITHCVEFGGIVLDGSYFVHYCELSGIFGERSEIGAGTTVGTRRFDDEPNEVIVRGVRHRVPFSGVLFGDYSRTGVGAMIMPGRIVGPSAVVGPGVVLTHNVEPFTMVLVKQEQEVRPWGREVYDR